MQLLEWDTHIFNEYRCTCAHTHTQTTISLHHLYYISDSLWASPSTSPSTVPLAVFLHHPTCVHACTGCVFLRHCVQMCLCAVQNTTQPLSVCMNGIPVQAPSPFSLYISWRIPLVPFREPAQFRQDKQLNVHIFALSHAHSSAPENLTDLKRKFSEGHNLLILLPYFLMTKFGFRNQSLGVGFRQKSPQQAGQNKHKSNDVPWRHAHSREREMTTQPRKVQASWYNPDTDTEM